MDGKNNSTFWPSYVDIMTTLFAIMLVLFVVSYSRFKQKERDLVEAQGAMEQLLKEYESLVNVYSTINEIDNSKLFGYDPTYLKHLVTIDVKYTEQKYSMYDLDPTKYTLEQADKVRADVLEAGHTIKDKIIKLENSIPESIKKNIKFLVVIEGQSSRIKFHIDDWKNNETLSYLRAQFLNGFWKSNGLDFDAIPRCELVICGSGEGGHPRYDVDENALRELYPNDKDYWRKWREEEGKNQRFLVHIVPVIGNIDVTQGLFRDYYKKYGQR